MNERERCTGRSGLKIILSGGMALLVAVAAGGLAFAPDVSWAQAESRRDAARPSAARTSDAASKRPAPRLASSAPGAAALGTLHNSAETGKARSTSPPPSGNKQAEHPKGGLAQSGWGMDYQEPTWPQAPDPAAMLGRLILGTGTVLVLCVATLWGGRRWLRGSPPRPAGSVGQLRVLQSLSLGHRCCLYLVQAGEARVLAGVDAGGFKSLVTLPAAFEPALAEAASAQSTEETTAAVHAGPSAHVSAMALNDGSEMGRHANAGH